MRKGRRPVDEDKKTDVAGHDRRLRECACPLRPDPGSRRDRAALATPRIDPDAPPGPGVDRGAHRELLPRGRPGRPRARAGTRLYPLSLHGVGLGLGSADPLDREHLARVRRPCAASSLPLVSEHACWATSTASTSTTCCRCPTPKKRSQHLAARVREVQDSLGRQLLMENLSAYVSFAHSHLVRRRVPGRRGRAQRLRPVARRQQRLCERSQSRFRPRRILWRRCQPEPCRKSISRAIHDDGSVGATC